ncbi:MAG: beta-ketoacyl synthase chain length factor [Elusimicrobiota bacterium]|jgi:4-coumarate--CoA ligase (photoactive yellow protein activation family)|nr:beta-ketoacyl synthase chain length factor [Elusimicrobiota bacterium]
MGKIFINAVSLVKTADNLEEFFEPKNLRRMDFFSKLALKAAASCLREVGIDLKAEKKIALIISSGYGPVKRTCDFMDSIIDDGDECASPLAFSSSVHNSALTSISILLNIKGPCLTVSNLEQSFEGALLTAKNWLNSGFADTVLLGAVDEEHQVINSVLKNNPQVFKDFTDTKTDYASAFFLLSKKGERELKEFNEDKTPKTPFNPSKDAFALAKKHSQILDLDDIARISSCFIKTELARSGQDIMGVFSEGKGGQLLKNTEPALKTKILRSLSRLFSKTEVDLQENAIAAACFDFFNKNKLINFFTSGSTGIVKNCLHTSKMIEEEAKGLLFLFPNIKRVVCTVPSSHSYGFIFGLQIPKLLGVPVVQKPPMPTLNWAEILQEGDLLIAFPMFLKQLILAGVKFPKGVFVLTSTAPCPDEVIERIYQNGASELVEIYGASEGGAIGYRRKAGEAFALLPFWQGEIIEGKLTSVKRRQTDLYFEMPDIIEVDIHGKFRPVGRKDNAVQVAGINVFPQKIERLLKQHPLVKDAAVRLMRPSEGERLKAFIVLKDSLALQGQEQQSDEILKDLHAFMKQNLTVHEVPRKITFGDKLPLTDFGKKRDW